MTNIQIKTERIKTERKKRERKKTEIKRKQMRVTQELRKTNFTWMFQSLIIH